MSKKISTASDSMGVYNSPDKNIERISFFIKKNKSENDLIRNLFGK